VEACPLCGRPFGAKREKHHLVPRAFGGRETVDLHPICHRKIHTTLADREIREAYPTIAALKAHPEIAKFITWVARKPPDFYRRTEYASGRRRR
jgi:hypothetical protein